MSLGVVILTRNEEADLPRCLASLRGWAPAVVLDCGSTDATQAVAVREGAELRVRPFTSHGEQRNWALDHCAGSHEWVLFLDADEVATPEFRAAVDRALATAGSEVAGFYCCWKLMMGERWLRRCDGFPRWQFRLFRKGRARFKDFGHAQKEDAIDGEAGYIREPYLHYAFSKGWSAWIERHNRYSTLEARMRWEAPVSWRDLFHRHSSRRVFGLKPLLSRIPGWPLLRFGLDYLGRLGFLDGRAGLIYCANMAYYELLIQLKMQELRELDRPS